MKSPRNLATRIRESEEFESWSKRFFLFMHSQEVQCTWSDILKWNKAALWNKTVMTQTQSSPKKRHDSICSFVVVVERQLPQFQGAANNVLSTLSASLKKYGAILWFIVLENKVFVILNVSRATKLLKDIETKQIHSNVIDSLEADLRRINPKFKSIDPLGVTFCPSDVLEIGSKSNTLDNSNISTIKLDVKVSSQTEETHEKKVVPSIVNEPENVVSKDVKPIVRAKFPVVKVVPSIVNEPENVVSKDVKPIMRRAESQVGKVAPFVRNQPVAVFSKTSGQWVEAHAVCVQEDSEGIFVTVRRTDGYELDYDIENVRAVMPAQNLSDSSLAVTTDDVIGETITHMQNESGQEVDFLDEPESEYSEEEHSPAQIDDAARGLFISEHQHIRTAVVLSDAELFKKIETFYILDKIRTIKSWLYGKIEQNEQLPGMITEILNEVSEMVKN